MNGIISANTLDILGRAGQRAGYIMKKEVTFDTVKNTLINMIFPPPPVSSFPENPNVIKSIELFGVYVHLLTENRLHNHIAKIIEQGRRELILNVNVHCYSMVRKHPWLKNFLNRANITFCDGAGVMLGAKILGKKRIPQRITYADWMWKFSEFAEKKGYSFFFLGAKPGVAEKAARKLQEKYPGLEIETHHGYFDKEAGSAENQEVIEKINASKANILVLGFGMPIQENWLKENQDKLDVNVSLTGGAVFDYLSGELKRGPRWLVDNGLECLARLLVEPKRLWKRYLIGNTVFLYKIIAERLKNTAREKETRDGRKIDIITKPYVASRKHPRIKLHGYAAKITHNGVRYYATINDASPEGIQLGNIPSVLTKQKDQLHITISDMLGSMEYQLTLQKRWAKKEGRRLTAAGFSIVKAPNEWKMLMPQPAT